MFGEAPLFALWREEAELRTEWKFQAVTSQPPYTRDEGTYLYPPVTSALDMKSGAWSLLVLSDRGGWDGWALGCTALTHLEKEGLTPPTPAPKAQRGHPADKSLWGWS